MPLGTMRTVEGTITLAQEGRFQLVSDEGIARLFMLAHDAPIEPQDLPDLVRARARVAVRYDERPDLIAAIVHEIGYAEETRP
ncbi:hypothetical protein [Azospirillum rugosum]|uniref:Uncharacterized protein n=1 Tax=Azospirillum rugosum TaxID=416170 RepID=A0ABS4SJP7_9PROT|nr:hypothetical protein [Azospirillum rugosum]MBP2292781.1 hypothetical protein [Azospirillum rugosum]MDQ0527040.1 hypothetical protein [Azospirillum rugosum]